MTTVARWEQTYQIPHTPSPEDALIAAPFITAAGNSVAMAGVVAHMVLSPDVSANGLTPWGMHKALCAMSEGHFSPKNPYNTVGWSNMNFLPTGIMTKDADLPNAAHRISGTGTQALSIAGLALSVSEKAYRTTPFFGKSQRREGTVSPHFRRINLMRYLAYTPSSQYDYHDMAVELGNGVVLDVRRALTEMRGSMLVDYSPEDITDPVYALGHDTCQQPHMNPGHTSAVTLAIWEFFQQIGNQEFHLSEAVGYAQKQAGLQDKREKFLEKEVIKRLSTLVAEGKVTRIASLYGNQRAASESSLTPTQRGVLKELIEGIDAFENHDAGFREYYSSQAAAIINQPKRFGTLLARSHERTKLGRNNSDNATAEPTIMNALFEIGSPQSPQQLCGYLAEYNPRSYCVNIIRNVLTDLERQGRVTATKGRRGYLFTLRKD